MLPKSWAETLDRQFLYTSRTFLINLDGVGEDEALVAPERGGNTLNWVAGHLVLHRAITQRLLGGPVPFDPKKYDRYQRGSEPVTDAAEAVPLAEMVEDFTALRQPFFAALREAESERLAQPAPFSPLNDPDETIGSLVAGLFFHEAYHVGQLGVLRRLTGRDGAIR